MKKFLFLAFFLLQGVFAFAQSNFKPGIVITNENDTLRGYIDYRTDEMNAKICRFKAGLADAEIKTFAPGEIAGFHFTDAGRYYVSRTIEIHAGQPKTVFLEFLVQGMLNLYYYSDVATRLDFYIFEDKNGKMTYTTKRPDLRTDETGKTYLKEDTSFRNIISHSFQEYKSVQNEVKNMNFDHRDMIKFVKNYHSALCTTGEECIVFEGKEDKKYLKLNFFASGGVEFQRYYEKYSNETLSSNHIAPIIRAGIELTAPRLSNAFSALLSFYFSTANWNLETSVVEMGARYGRNHSFNANRLGGDLAFQYTYPKGRIRPNVEIGINIFDYNFSTSYKYWGWTLPTKWSTDYERTYLENNTAFTTFFKSFHFGAGVNVLVRKEQAIFFNVKYKIDKPNYFYVPLQGPEPWNNKLWQIRNNNPVHFGIFQFEIGYRF